ncbi:EsaB/YukD family protein [Microbacterium sp. BK668]|uniref:EsaB/YukD family protein n=1 Tax=Microbacterium sp. BK668 TaxID=2512118 RepID=UPI0010E382DA|nr:EsaB/YukD family protein [Microbacterium sp. BK668]TDN91330.1 type VII secretion system (Wss) protein YukD [Microbacterium sp. BK668]
MSLHTRLTVAGTTRRAEVVVSSDEPLGAVLPRLLDLLGETGGTVARPLTLVAADGEQLDIGRSPQQLDLGDGALLRLVPLDAAPPPPVVIDVTDAAADALEARPDRWDDRARMIAGATGIALAAAAAGLIAPYGSALAAAWTLLLAVVVLLGIATLLGLLRLAGVSGCVGAAAAGLLLPLGLAGATAAGAGGYDSASAALLGAAVVIATGSTVVLLALGVALRRPGAAAGGAVGAVLASILLALLLLGVGPAAAAAVAGTLAAFATGPLPWIALSASGVTRLDQGVAAGERVERPRAFASIADAYSALAWSVVTVSAVLAVTGVALVLASELWSGLLAVAFALIAALRVRAFPLRTQVWSLLAAAAAIASTALLTQLAGPLAWVGVAIAALAAIVLGAAVLARPAPHQRARLRGAGNVIETLAVVALLPLLLGALGIYAELLGMFGGGS